MSFRPHLVRWEAEYAACGLVVVEVSGGDADFESSRRRLGRWIVTHAVLWDRGNVNAGNYRVRAWPSAFLIGPDGKVAWQGNPSAITRDRDTEADFRDLLQKQLRLAESARK